jgi:hypothetical protein
MGWSTSFKRFSKLLYGRIEICCLMMTSKSLTQDARRVKCSASKAATGQGSSKQGLQQIQHKLNIVDGTAATQV